MGAGSRCAKPGCTRKENVWGRGLCLKCFGDLKLREKYARPKKTSRRGPSRKKSEGGQAAPALAGGERDDDAAQFADAVVDLVRAEIERRTEFLRRVAFELREVALRTRHELMKEREARKSAEIAVAEAMGEKKQRGRG